MQYQSRIPSPAAPQSQPLLTPLASLSHYGGVESTVFTVLAFCLVGGACFTNTLLPIIGSLGTLLAIVGISFVAERLIRPLVLWALGRNVYLSLVKIGGKATADEVASIYAAGLTLSRKQLEQLINKNAKPAAQESGGQIR